MIDPRDTDTLAGLHDTLGSVTVPDIMHGDNLAITLCTAYDNPDQDADEETGWTPDAIAGQEAVLAAIRDHYDPAIRCAIALRAQAAKDKARIERLEAALRFYVGAWQFKANKRFGRQKWTPKDELLDDGGNRARAALEDGE